MVILILIEQMVEITLYTFYFFAIFYLNTHHIQLEQYLRNAAAGTL